VYSTIALKWNRKIQCGNSCRRIGFPLYFCCGNGLPHLFLAIHPCRGEARGVPGGGTAPPKFCLAPPVAPQIFRVTSCHCIEILHRPLTAPLVAKPAPPVAPPNENVWLRPCTPACQKQFLDKSTAQHEIRCFFIDHYSAVSNNFFNLLYSISKIALPRYSRVSYNKLNVWKFGHCLTANFTFPAVTWKNIVWSFLMPLWCNKHHPE